MLHFLEVPRQSRRLRGRRRICCELGRNHSNVSGRRDVDCRICKSELGIRSNQPCVPTDGQHNCSECDQFLRVCGAQGAVDAVHGGVSSVQLYSILPCATASAHPIFKYSLTSQLTMSQLFDTLLHILFHTELCPLSLSRAS